MLSVKDFEGFETKTTIAGTHNSEVNKRLDMSVQILTSGRSKIEFVIFDKHVLVFTTKKLAEALDNFNSI